MPYGPENRRVRHRGYGLFADAVSVAAGGPIFAAVSQDGAVGRVMTSNDGIAWTLQTTPLRTWVCITYAPALGLWIAHGQSGFAMTSPDGVVWTERLTPAVVNPSDIAWSPALGRAVVVGNNAVVYTDDGINWNSATVVVAGAWTGVTWSPDLGIFMAVNGTNCMTSVDGDVWIVGGAMPASTSAVKVAWSPTLSLFMTSGNNGFGAEDTCTSPDGLIWTARADGSANGWPDIVWAGDAINLFVQCGGVSGNVIMYSANGIAFTRPATPASGIPSSIAYSSQLGLFATVTDAISTTQVLTSPDAVNWTLRNTINPGQIWRGIAARA